MQIFIGGIGCFWDETEYEGGDFEFDFRNNDKGANQPLICKDNNSFNFSL